MKKTLFTLALVLLAVAAQAQTSLKVHSSGQISLQSATTSYGIQIPTSGALYIEPNLLTAYSKTSQAKAFNQLAKSFVVRMSGGANISPVGDVFYVLGNGNAYAYGYYTLGTPGGGGGGGGNSKALSPIVGASELAAGMKGYYMDSYEFGDTSKEELENCENIAPEALEGISQDIEKGKTIGLDAEVLEHILPEAVRHDPDGNVGINYNAVVTVLVEAFKEQQAKIELLEAILRENGLTR